MRSRGPVLTVCRVEARPLLRGWMRRMAQLVRRARCAKRERTMWREALLW